MFIGLVCNRENMETRQLFVNRKWFNKSSLINMEYYGLIQKKNVPAWTDMERSQGRLVREDANCYQCNMNDPSYLFFVTVHVDI